MKTLKTAILISLLSVSFNSFADLNTGLIGYWSFDDCTAKDNSKNGNNGLINKAQNCVAGISGIDKALTFNGINNVVSIQNSPSLNNITNQLSTVTWVKFNDIHTTSYGYDWQSIINKSGFVSSYGLMLAFGISANPKILRFYHNGASLDITDYAWNDIKENQWYLIATIYDGTNAKIYIDRKLVSTNSVTGNIRTNTENLYIGKSVNNWYPYYLNADVSSIRIYNRALTNSEITALYQQVTKSIKNGVSSNTDQCINNANWCVHPAFTVLGVTKESDIPINLINTSYIVDGLIRTVNNGKVNITANLYNRGYADAILDIYDKQGNWTGFISLNGNRPETSIVGDIWDKWTTTYDSVTDEFSTFDPRDSGSSEKLTVGFSIPRGGYAVLSKNSPTALANTVLNTALAIFDEPEWIKPKGKDKAKLLAIFKNAVINKGIVTLLEKLTDATNRNDQEKADSIQKELTEKLFSVTYDVFVENSSLVINIIGDSKTKHFAKKAKKYFSPVSGLIESAEAIATGLSITGQWIDIAKANNDRAVYFK
jgi:hypothetical protein